MKNLLIILFISLSFSAMAQPGLIKYSVNPYNFKINKDTIKSLNLRSPLYFENDTTIAIDTSRFSFTVTKNATRDSIIFSFFDGTRVAIRDSIGAGGGGGSPGGSNTHIQYNNSGSFGGSADYTYSPTGAIVTLAGYMYTDTIYGGGTSAGNITVIPTSHATKGKFLIGTSAYDAANNRWGINEISPQAALEVVGAPGVAIVRNTSTTSYGEYRIYNDQNSSARALSMSYAGSAYSGSLLSGGTTGEAGAITTNGNYPLMLGAFGTARLSILGNGNLTFGTSGYVASTNRLGIGTAAPNYIIETSENVNGVSRIRGKNTNSGTTAQMIYELGNNIDNAVQIGMTSSGYTTTGLTTAGMGFIQVNQGSLLLKAQNTGTTGDIIFGVGGTTGNTEAFRIKGTTGIFFPFTNTTTGTTGAQTINKASGKVNFAAAATTLVVTNSLVTTASIVHIQIEGTDATATSARVTLAAGSFTITLNAAATAETKVSFFVIN